MHHAVNSGNETIIQMLLDAEADVLSEDAHGNTPLHFAAQKGITSVVLLLLAHKADVFAQNKAGATYVNRWQSLPTSPLLHQYDRLAMPPLTQSPAFSMRARPFICGQSFAGSWSASGCQGQRRTDSAALCCSRFQRRHLRCITRSVRRPYHPRRNRQAGCTAG